MTALPQTPTALVGAGARVSPLYPLKRLLAERQFKLLMAGLAFCGLGTGLVGTLVAIKMLKAPQMVFVLDAAGNITSGPIESLRKGSPLLTNIVSQATLQFFSRGPGGLDNPELAQRLFTNACFVKVMDDVRTDQPEMEAKDLRYKPEIREYDLSIPDDSGRRIIRVSGFITISGAVDGLALGDKKEFKLTLALVPNPDFGARGMYPFVASAFRKIVSQ